MNNEYKLIKMFDINNVNIVMIIVMIIGVNKIIVYIFK
jgi:hypothetical protein